LKITDVFLVKNRDEGNPIFYASVEVDNAFIIKGFKILRNNHDGSLFISLPSQKDQKGKRDNEGRIIFYPTCYFKKTEDRANLTEEAETFKEHLSDTLVEAANNYLSGNYRQKTRY
jgi:DNA-binding cell septation regulator SpoVG